MDDATCKNCKYFKSILEYEIGNCLYNPPTVIYSNDYKQPQSVFPEVGELQWCNKHYYEGT